jgi:precorrin-6x reductase
MIQFNQRTEKLHKNLDLHVEIRRGIMAKKNIVLLHSNDMHGDFLPHPVEEESGEIGGVVEKIEAANQKDIAIIMIQRPEIELLEKDDIVNDLTEMDEKIKSF